MDKHELPEQEPNLNPEKGRVDFSDLGPLFSDPHPEEEKSPAVDFSDLGPIFDGTQAEPQSDPQEVPEEPYTPLFAQDQAEAVPQDAEPSSEETPAEPYTPRFAQEQEEIPQNGDEALPSEEAAEEPYNPLFAQEQEEVPQNETLPSEEAAEEPYNPLFAQEQEEVPQDGDEALPSEEAVEEPYNPLFAQEQEEIPQDGDEALPSEEAGEESYGPHFAEDSQAQPDENAPFSPVLPGEAAWLLKKISELPNEHQEAVPEDLPEEPEAEVQAEEIQEEPLEDLSEEAAEPEPQEEPAEESEDTQASTEEQASEEMQEAPVPEEVQEDQAEPEQAEASEEAAADAEPPAKHTHKATRPIRKGRPKRKKGEGFFGIPNLLVTAVWIGITILIGVTMGRMIWVCAADVLAFGREDKPVTITIYEADTIDDITRKLHEGDLIRYPGLFKFYASLAVDDGEIQPGIWDLNTRYDYHALVSMMSPSSSRDVVEVMIPEGYSCRQIFALLEENKICTAMDLASYAASGELDEYWFLEGVPRGETNCLEGFLFPDTYQFYKNDSPKNVLQKMLTNFGNKFDEEMQGQINTLNDTLADLMRKGGHGEDYIASHRFTVRDVINVASLIEKETSSAEEGYTIASVIYNRLFNWGDNVPYLNIDATIIYALGGKTKLTQEDLKVNSPYNTYTNTGLTPGPIANPGLASIRAALAPAETDYYYYVLDPAAGSHRFSTTYDEHKANIASIGG